jgi:hypothetical protein
LCWRREARARKSPAKKDSREGNAMTIVKHSIDAETAEKAVAAAAKKAVELKLKMW